MSYLTAAPNQNEAPSTPLPAAVPPPLPPLMMSSQENIQKYLRSSEPQYITAESVRQNKLLTSNKQQKRSENLDNRMPSGKGKFIKDRDVVGVGSMSLANNINFQRRVLISHLILKPFDCSVLTEEAETFLLTLIG